MATLNKAILVGNVVRDPEVKDLNGTSVCSFTIAVSEKFKTRDGLTRETVLFMDCAAWEHLAETAGKWLRKGRAVLVEGKLVSESWEDKTTGQKRSRMSLRVSNLQFLSAPKEEAAPPATSATISAAPVIPKDVGDEEDIPF